MNGVHHGCLVSPRIGTDTMNPVLFWRSGGSSAHYYDSMSALSFVACLRYRGARDMNAVLAAFYITCQLSVISSARGRDFRHACRHSGMVKSAHHALGAFNIVHSVVKTVVEEKRNVRRAVSGKKALFNV